MADDACASSFQTGSKRHDSRVLPDGLPTRIPFIELVRMPHRRIFGQGKIPCNPIYQVSAFDLIMSRMQSHLCRVEQPEQISCNGCSAVAITGMTKGDLKASGETVRS